MSQPVRVMQIIDSLNYGGAEILLRDLTRGLLSRGYKVRVCYNTPGPLIDEFAAMSVSMVQLPRLARVDPVLLWRMWREIRRERPDIVHTHLFKSDFHGRLAARLANVPVVISTLHNCHRWAKNPVLGSTYGITARSADHIIAVSEEVREHAIRYAHIPSQKVETIDNAILIERFLDIRELGLSIRQEFNIPVNVPLVGIIARLSKQKDHANFLQAAVHILQKVPQTRFLIVGEGPLRSSLEALTESLNLTEAVIFCGARQDIPSILGALDMLVFSSKWEGLPVALLEGMASSLPVVSTNVGGVPGVIKDGITGLLVPPSNAELLAQACLQLIEDPLLRRKMGLEAQTHIQTNYSMDAMVNKITQLYLSLLENVRR